MAPRAQAGERVAFGPAALTVGELAGARGSSLAMLSFCYHGNPKFGKNEPKVTQLFTGPSSWASVAVSASGFHLTLEGEKSNE